MRRPSRAGRRELAGNAAAGILAGLPGRQRPAARSSAPDATPDYGELLQLCPDAVWIQCEDHVAFANRAAHSLFRAGDGATLIGAHWHRLVAPACWADAEAHCTTLAAGAGDHAPRRDLTYLALDGSPIIAESTSARVDFGGRPAVLVVVHDISERRATEQELREQRVKLEQLVLERTADLRQALADARLSDQAKDTFLANVSHELRTPLGGIIGLLELALGRCADSTLRAYLEKAAHAGKHLSRIINDLLDLSKVVAGRITLETIAFNLGELLQRVRDVIAHKAEAKGLRLQIRADPDIPRTLVGDPTRIEQILLNLAGNAIKFTDAGKVDVHVTLVTRSEDHVRLSIDVSDSGIGMTTEEVSGLFRAFTQASAATSRNYGGTGLGLALSQRLAEAMGGRITVRSSKGQGSVFSLMLNLPIAGRPVPAAPKATASTPATRAQARVLLVEDDPLNTEIVTELLQAVGIYPRLASDGHEAVALLAEEGPAAYDLVLMDIQMPVLDGQAATRLIRSWSGFAALPIVAMTAHALEHERKNSLAAGMNDQISKPFDHASFYAMLDKWLPWGSPAPAAAAPAEAPAATTPACLDVAAALARFSGNEQRYRNWLARFVEESPDVAPQLRRALAAGATESAAGTVHSFKGTAGTLGLARLEARAAELEHAIRAGRDAVPELRQLERAIDEARREIIARFGL